MNENAQKWVEALRSGEYEQARGKLCRKSDDGEENFCCLGVACELAIAEGVPVTKHVVKTIDDVFRITYDGMEQTLPARVREWLDLGYANGSYNHSALTTDNDSGATFVQIANIIEREQDLLFRFRH